MNASTSTTATASFYSNLAVGQLIQSAVVRIGDEVHGGWFECPQCHKQNQIAPATSSSSSSSFNFGHTHCTDCRGRVLPQPAASRSSDLFSTPSS